jgi:hypothetical protein
MGHCPGWTGLPIRPRGSFPFTGAYGSATICTVAETAAESTARAAVTSHLATGQLIENLQEAAAVNARSTARGIYTLANDSVYDWLVAFLESRRLHEPNLPVVVIPFDDRMERVNALRDRYSFDVLEHESLKALDQIGASYFPDDAKWPHAFRKFAAFWGPFEKFVFVDSDVVLLGPLHEIFDRAEASDVEFVCGDIDIDQVYAPGKLRDQIMATGVTTGFNTGFFMSWRNTLTLDQVRRLGEEGLAVRRDLPPAVGEQPFINWCVAVAGLKVQAYFDLVPDMCFSPWAKRGPVADVNGAWRLLDTRWKDVGRRMPLLHWAGYGLDFKMPNMRIFLHYRLAHATNRERAQFLFRWTANSVQRTGKALRKRLKYAGASLLRTLTKSTSN